MVSKVNESTYGTKDDGRETLQEVLHEVSYWSPKIVMTTTDIVSYSSDIWHGQLLHHF